MAEGNLAETERRHDIVLDDAAIADLARHFRGELIRRDNARYDTARSVWNGAIDRYPKLVARCTDVADVLVAVRCERELVVAVRGDGHNVAGTAVCDDGVVIDLSPMKGMWVDPVARTARAQPGLLWVYRFFAANYGANYARLAAVKATHDPYILFHIN